MPLILTANFYNLLDLYLKFQRCIFQTKIYHKKKEGLGDKTLFIRFYQTTMGCRFLLLHCN